MMALLFHFAETYAWAGCLLVPAVGLVLFVGAVFWQWSERQLPRLWPSGKKLMLGEQDLTLSRRNHVCAHILLNQRFSVVRWRSQAGKPMGNDDVPSGQLRLACQLSQQPHALCVFTSCSPQEWRRVPNWKQFPLLEYAGTPGQSAVLRDRVVRSVFRQPAPAPAHRGESSLPKGDPEILWPAELYRRKQGWVVSFEDFCAVMSAVERSKVD
jgi:hypothetical protein